MATGTMEYRHVHFRSERGRNELRNRRGVYAAGLCGWQIKRSRTSLLAYHTAILHPSPSRTLPTSICAMPDNCRLSETDLRLRIVMYCHSYSLMRNVDVFKPIHRHHLLILFMLERAYFKYPVKSRVMRPSILYFALHSTLSVTVSGKVAM